MALAHQEKTDVNTPIKLQIKVGFQVTVEQYDAPTDTFLLTILNDPPGEHVNYASSAALALAIGFKGDHAAFAKQIDQMLGHKYYLVQDLPLLAQEEMAKRRRSH